MLEMEGQRGTECTLETPWTILKAGECSCQVILRVSYTEIRHRDIGYKFLFGIV